MIRLCTIQPMGLAKDSRTQYAVTSQTSLQRVFHQDCGLGTPFGDTDGHRVPTPRRVVVDAHRPGALLCCIGRFGYKGRLLGLGAHRRCLGLHRILVAPRDRRNVLENARSRSGISSRSSFHYLRDRLSP